MRLNFMDTSLQQTIQSVNLHKSYSPLSGTPMAERICVAFEHLINRLLCDTRTTTVRLGTILVRPQNWLGEREHRIPGRVSRVEKGYQQAAERIWEPSLILGKGGKLWVSH